MRRVADGAGDVAAHLKRRKEGRHAGRAPPGRAADRARRVQRVAGPAMHRAIGLPVKTGKGHVGVAQKNATVDEPRTSDLYDIGTVCDMGRLLRLPDGSASVLVQGRSRVRIIEWTQATPYLRAKVQLIHEPQAQSAATEALMPSPTKRTLAVASLVWICRP